MIGAVRSLLFVPGDDAMRLEKAARSSADAVIIDLEDGVALSAKPVAHAGFAAAVHMIRQYRKFCIVRINSDPHQQRRDLSLIKGQQVNGIMVPKVESASDVALIANAMIQQSSSGQIDRPALIALIESARGVNAAAQIAEEPSVAAIALGTEDFALSMGVSPDPAILDLPVRMLALAAHAHNKPCFAVPMSIAAFRDREAICAAAQLASAYGSCGALCIHPAQVDAANVAFAPTAAQIAEASAVLTQWKAAQEAGKGVIACESGMIDAPVVARAELILRRASLMG